MDHYSTIIHNAVEKHALLTEKYVILRPNTKCYSVTQIVRDGELKDYGVTQDWRFIDKFSETQPPKQQNSYIKPNKTFSQKIEECGKDNKQLIKLSKSLMVKKHETILSSSTSNKELANEFS